MVSGLFCLFLFGVVIFYTFYNVEFFQKRYNTYFKVQSSIQSVSAQYNLLFQLYRAGLRRYEYMAFSENVEKNRGYSAI